MRIAITGATGNVGSALLRHLSAEGHDLVGLARRLPSDGPMGGPLGVQGVTWVHADLTEDACRPTLRAAFEGADAVVHLAWGFQPTHDVDYLHELGVGGTHRVLEAVAATGVPQIVHQSSVGVYSPRRDDEPVDESWPTDGVPTSPYSRHKVAAERLLDAFAAENPGVVVSRTRPGLIGQRRAGSSLLRYGLPAVVPAKALTLMPVLPVDRRLRLPFIHAHDVADAIARILARRASGPFNLAAPAPLTRDDIAAVLDARPLHVPSGVLRAVTAATWRARLQKVDAGWVDLAFSVPMLHCGRAGRELDWVASRDAVSVFREVIQGMADSASDRTDVLRVRTVAGELRALARRGPGALRRRP